MSVRTYRLQRHESPTQWVIFTAIPAAVTSADYARYLAAPPPPLHDARMGWWGNKSETAVVICYRCRKRISPEELSQGGHVHDWEPRPDKIAPAADSTPR